MGAIGSGKTTLITKLVEKLKGQWGVAVFNGDATTSDDADQIEKLGIPVVQIATINGKLTLDAEYQKNAGDFLTATKTNAAFDSLQTALLVAFDGMKRINLPPADKKPTVFELRTYISPSEAKGGNKIKMFENGEITVMKEVGLAPVFFGRTIAGPVMPSLMYLTCGEDADAHRKHWSAFGAAPVWKQLQADPQYKDNMTGMIRVMLKRTSASQL